MSELLEPESTAAANDTHDAIEFDSLRWRLFFLLFPSITGIAVCSYGTWPWLEAAIVAWTSYFFLCGASMFHEFTHRHTHPRSLGPLPSITTSHSRPAGRAGRTLLASTPDSPVPPQIVK